MNPFTIIEIATREDGYHNFKTVRSSEEVPEGWARISDAYTSSPHFPYGTMQTEVYTEPVSQKTYPVVIAWSDIDPDAPPNPNEERIAALKEQLAATDYAVIKIAEGMATAEEYADVIAQRRAWRAEINELEKASLIQRYKSLYERGEISANDLADAVRNGILTLEQYEEITS